VCARMRRRTATKDATLRLPKLRNAAATIGGDMTAKKVRCTPRVSMAVDSGAGRVDAGTSRGCAGRTGTLL
jgi:hypothetical protein